MLMKIWQGKGLIVTLESVDVPWDTKPVFKVEVKETDQYKTFDTTTHVDFAGAIDRYHRVIAAVEPESDLVSAYADHLAWCKRP